MLTLRRADERGHANHGWLEAYHSFSFADYHDPEHMGISVLRVINEDRVLPQQGFGAHPHRNMEIITYVLEGAIEHKDSMGSHSILKAGEVQVMSAGTGVVHSEYNPAPRELLHLLQIWILPDKSGLTPTYAQKDFSDVHGVSLIVSPDEAEGSLRINQDARIYKVLLENEKVSKPLGIGRTVYFHVAQGGLLLNGEEMQAGDGATLHGEAFADIEVKGRVEALLFDLP